MQGSEIAHIRACIEEELVAMRQGLSGLAAGTARHRFVQAKMQRIGEQQKQLASHVGEAEATQICYEVYVEILEKR